MADIFSPNVNAVRKSFERMNKAFGFEQDRDLVRYEKLNERDFDHLASRFGQEPVFRYIQVMESRRLNRRRE